MGMCELISLLFNKLLSILKADHPCQNIALLVLFRWIVELQRPVMTTSTNSSVLKGMGALSYFSKFKLNLFLKTFLCVHRCCCLCWCVVIRQNSQLFKTICSAVAGNGSSGKTPGHICTSLLIVYQP